MILVDQHSSMDILHVHMAQALVINNFLLKPYNGVFVGSLGKQVNMNGIVTLRMIIGIALQF